MHYFILDKINFLYLFLTIVTASIITVVGCSFMPENDENKKHNAPVISGSIGSSAVELAVTKQLPVPSITDFIPVSGKAGETITITGTNFDLTPKNNIIMFSGSSSPVPAMATSSTSTAITLNVPSFAVTGTVSLSISSQKCASASSFTVLPDTASVTVYIVSDSTASYYGYDRYPRAGWGQMLQNYFNPDNVVINNTARSGRSSKSFIVEGWWDRIRQTLKTGDYVFIQHGHNDEVLSDPAKGTDPDADASVPGCFKYYLSKYINESKAAGAIPVLITPVCRDIWLNPSTIDPANHGAWPQSVRDLAAATGTVLIDLHALSKTLFESCGQSYVHDNFFMNIPPGAFPEKYPHGCTDTTHIQTAGADVMAKLISQAVIDINLPIKTYVK